MTTVRTRIAPSPTGYLHIGTARTALFNYLYAKKHNGVFILRIEDTDIERSDKKYEMDIFDGLRWLGIEANESPEKGGNFAPYRQSERFETYEKYLRKLLKGGGAFYCPHSEKELKDEKREQLEKQAPSRHTCSARDQNLQRGIIRLKNTGAAPINFSDLVRGDISFNPKLLGDFSLAKDPKTPLYNFAVTIDDAEMEISHVIRGEDHISNTPKQILIQEALGLTRPEYAHLPLILGPDRSKLSKRHGATSIREFRHAGYLPEALVNLMAFLGWNPGGERELFSMDELIQEFDLAKVQKSGAIFNLEKLDWLNGAYLRQISPQALTDLALPYLETTMGPLGSFSRDYLEQVVALEQPRLKKLSAVGERVRYFFAEPEYPPDLLRWQEMSWSGIVKSLQRSHTLLLELPDQDFTPEKLEMYFSKEIGAGDKGELLWPLRVALSGERASPGPFEILATLKERGREHILNRIKTAIRKAELERRKEN